MTNRNNSILKKNAEERNDKFHFRLETDSNNTESSSKSVPGSNNDNNDHINEVVCLICAENINIASLSPCNHTVCHTCSFRNVVLYKKTQCLVCRSDTPKLIFTENLLFDKFESFNESQLLPAFKNDHGIRYTSEYAKDETLKLLEFTCPIKTCNMAGIKMSNFKELNNHVINVHNKFYCDLCAKFKKAFISELKLYTRKQLHQHQSKGDDVGFKGHPECKFCSNKKFYSEDELYVHMRDNHEKCHICQQIDPNNPQYFKNYDHLSQHFKSAHYICNVQSCLDQKFVIFADEFDLQTHMAKEHSALYGNNIFSTSTFNNQLYTVSNAGKKKAPVKKEFSEKDNYVLKKKRLEERAKHYLNYSQLKFDEFISVNIQYSDEKISAQDVVSKYHEIFKDSKDVDYDLLIYELSGLFPSKSSLCKDLEIINKPKLESREMKEKFPALPGTSSTFSKTFWDNGTQPKSSTKLKLSSSGSTKIKTSIYDLPSLPIDDTPIFQTNSKNNSWVTSRSSSNSSITTRGISSNSTPINGYSIPGYNPVLPTKSKKAKNPWNSTNKVATIGGKNSSSTTSLASSISNASSSIDVNTSTSYPSLSSVVTPKPVVVVKKVSKSVDPNLFPSLPNDPPKKVIPRVNPIDTPNNTWGGFDTTSSKATAGSSSTDAFDLDVIGTSLKTVKKGKKGKKVVYHIGL
jgi:hypothetical protein